MADSRVNSVSCPRWMKPHVKGWASRASALFLPTGGHCSLLGTALVPVWAPSSPWAELGGGKRVFVGGGDGEGWSGVNPSLLLRCWSPLSLITSYSAHLAFASFSSTLLSFLLRLSHLVDSWPPFLFLALCVHSCFCIPSSCHGKFGREAR